MNHNWETYPIMRQKELIAQAEHERLVRKVAQPKRPLLDRVITLLAWSRSAALPVSTKTFRVDESAVCATC